MIGWGLYQASKVKGVQSFAIECPFCQSKNLLTLAPTSDFRCNKCNREVPVHEDGSILDVFQVRCGFCNTLNYYSEKSTGLICEECDREIPIASDEETHAKKMFEHYTVHDDDHPYDLILTEAPSSEEMIKCLQTMLALNRNQVKDIINELPQTLLQGIPKKKAELLIAQITVHKGKATSEMSQT
jgi:ribosomal protein L37AE/L43A